MLQQTYDLQLEKGIGNLQHQHVGVVVFVTHKNTLTSAAHAMNLEVLFKALEAGDDRRVLLWLSLLGSKGVVR